MDKIEEVMRAIGCETDPARAEATHTSDRQWRRARAGNPVGEQFIGGVLEAIRGNVVDRRLETDFEGLFEVVTQEAEPVA